MNITETKTIHLTETCKGKVIELIFKKIIVNTIGCKTLRTIEAKHKIGHGSWTNCLTITSMEDEEFRPKDITQLKLHLDKWEKGLSRKFFLTYNMLK